MPVVTEAEITVVCLQSRTAGGPQKLKEEGRTPAECSEGAQLCRHLMLDVWPPELGGNTCLLFQTTQFVVLC